MTSSLEELIQNSSVLHHFTKSQLVECWITFLDTKQSTADASKSKSVNNKHVWRFTKICNHNYFRCFTHTRETCYCECVSGYGCSQALTSFHVYFYLTRGSEDILSDLHPMHSVNSAEASNIFKITSTCLIHCYKLQPHMFWGCLYSTCMEHGNNISMLWNRSGRHIVFRKSLRETASPRTDRTIWKRKKENKFYIYIYIRGGGG